MDGTWLTAAGLVVRRAGRPVLDGLDWCHAGGIALLVGDNGAGKSTLLAAAAGLLPVAAGLLAVRGAPPGSTAARRALAYLPERFLPPWHLTGWESLEWALALRGEPLDRAAARHLAARLRLPEEALARPARAFSKGMTQKLGLMAAFLSQAPLIALDEPDSGLDPSSRFALLDEMARLARAGRALIVSTHMLDDALWLARALDGAAPVTVSLLRGGRIAATLDGPQMTAAGIDAWFRPPSSAAIPEVSA